MWQKDFSKILNDQVQLLKAKNPKYSLRAFARKIGLSIGPLSNVLKGNQSWNLTSKRAAEILGKLDIKPRVRNRILVKMGESPQHQKETLRDSNYNILTDWTYYPILFSFDLPARLRSPGKIAERLGIDEQKVKSVIEDLIKRKLLVTSETGEISRPEVFVSTSDDIPNALIKKHHEISLALSKKALHDLPVAKRDVTSLTFVGSEKQLARLKQEIRKLYEKASSLVNCEEENDTVYRLSVQLYPMEFSKK